MNHCCSAMAKALEHHCAEHESRFDCPDALISYNEKFDEYGLIIHDGGTAVSSIAYCPYCGHKLPKSKRDLWFDILESMGYEILRNRRSHRNSRLVTGIVAKTFNKAIKFVPGRWPSTGRPCQGAVYCWRYEEK